MPAMNMTAPTCHHDADVLIIGAGPAGLALACALADAGMTVQLLEQATRDSLESPADDGREIAMTHRARRVMETLGLWQQLPPAEIAPLREARVIDGGGPSMLRFEPEEASDAPLGWLVPNHRIRHAALKAATSRSAVRLLCEARVSALSIVTDRASVRLDDGREFSAALLVAADSRLSQSRRLAGIGAAMHDFGRSVVVGPVAHERDHQGIAWECFRYGNTLALLPMSGRHCSAVVTVPGDQAVEWLALSDAEFAARIAQQAEGRLGAVQATGPRQHYPLVGVYAHRFAAHRFALIGDAAVGMHPVTAHGWNFGLYGVEVLARELRAAHAAGRDLGALPALQAYEREHRRTTLPVYLGTNALVSLFSDERALPRRARQLLLTVAERVPPFSGLIKSAIRRQLTGVTQGLSGGRP
ncbi:ubiquinone biosynthesis UbiH/UbiF/VisC/COQ6 family hydroxylase [Roseateles toxinivorans]|uniref:Ubiquinone biosynthesis UbiH/UbiF/VisC/COQ6 family hydroxylase n=2 Tax=Roseateles toxinivorans TaxID=270368 RepID=A0A4R6QJS3_9BURK|nr:ubiquinone biosynthesis UbiH/UbiF/VisC/COQ6 family hydroxylase [Roseateles toxinivorans]